jgi:hypothetical protein
VGYQIDGEDAQLNELSSWSCFYLMKLNLELSLRVLASFFVLKRCDTRVKLIDLLGHFPVLWLNYLRDDWLLRKRLCSQPVRACVFGNTLKLERCYFFYVVVGFAFSEKFILNAHTLRKRRIYIRSHHFLQWACHYTLINTCRSMLLFPTRFLISTAL